MKKYILISTILILRFIIRRSNNAIKFLTQKLTHNEKTNIN